MKKLITVFLEVEKSMKSKKLLLWLGLITFASIIGCLLGLGINASITSVNAQDDKKIVQLAYSRDPQLKISEIKLGQQPVKFGELFDTDLDWIKNLAFKLENISDKPIVFLQVNVNFPETRSNGNLMSYGLTFGQRPDSKFSTDKEPMLLKPGETLEISLDKEKDRIYKFVNERQPIETIHNVELEIGFIIFEDKTAWTAGTFLHQDSDNPDKYNPIETNRNN